MAKVTFLEDHLYETQGPPTYQKGRTYTITAAEAAKYIGSGVAVEYEPEPSPESKAEAKAEAKAKREARAEAKAEAKAKADAEETDVEPEVDA